MEPKYSGEINTVSNKKIKYVIHPECLVCRGKHSKTGKDIRLEVDKKLIDGVSTKEISAWLRDDHGILITAYKVNTHKVKHSSYIGTVEEEITTLVKDTKIKQLANIVEEYIPAEEVLSDIITLGGKKIRDGEIEVDGRLLLGAIKEEGSRKKTGTIQDLWAGLNKGRFVEGELADGKD